MSMNGDIALALAKKYTKDTANGLGAVAGASCTIKSIEPTETGNRITFEWTGDNGTKQTATMEVINGKDGVAGDKGDPGESVSVMVNGTKYEPVDGVINLPDYSTGGDVGTPNFKYANERPVEPGTIGELVFNNSPEPNGFVGWVYTQLGWFGFGKIESNSSEPIEQNAFTLSDGSQFLVKDENGEAVPFLFKV